MTPEVFAAFLNSTGDAVDALLNAKDIALIGGLDASVLERLSKLVADIHQLQNDVVPDFE